MKIVITLSKLISLLFSSLPLLVLLSVNVHTINTRNDLARLVMGTVFLVSLIGERAKRGRHSQDCSIENPDIYVVCMSFLPFDP